MRNFDWGIAAFIAALTLAIGVLVYWAVSDYRGYRQNCWDNGGHIEEIRNTDICLTPDGRVIYVDSWNNHVTKPRGE